MLPIETPQSTESPSVYQHNVISSLSLCKLQKKEKNACWLKRVGLGVKKRGTLIITFFNIFITIHNSYAWVGNMGPS